MYGSSSGVELIRVNKKVSISENVRYNKTEGFSPVIFAAYGNMSNVEKVIGEYPDVTTFQPTYPAANVILSVASTSVNDASAGSGAQLLLITGWDINFNRITVNNFVDSCGILQYGEIVSLNGQTEVDTTSSFFRIESVVVLTAGSSEANEGTIYISDNADTFTSGVPDTRLYQSVGIGRGIHSIAHFTVPPQRKFYSTRFLASSSANQANSLETKIFSKQVGSTVKYHFATLFLVAGGNNFDARYDPSCIFGGEKTDITYTGELNSGNEKVQLYWQGIFENIV